MKPKRNTDPKFVGIEGLKAKQRETLEHFKRCAADGNWFGIHRSHYDWWMFPIDEPSSYGFAYTVYDGDVAELRTDAAYVSRYLEGASLLAQSWGWDLEAVRPVVNPGRGQSWQDWPIRLYKATKSVKLFGFEPQFQSFRAYGRGLLAMGTSFEYSRDLTYLFK
jgi:hypothetical protein